MADAEPVQVRRRRLLPEVAGRDAGHLGGAARGLRQHPGHRRALRHLLHRGRRRPTCRATRARPGRTRSPGSSRRSRPGCSAGIPTGIPDAVREQAEFEIRGHPPMGFAGYFLVVADFINWAKENGIRVGPGRGSGAGSMVRVRHADHRSRPARARPDLRALPQPRTRLDARLRHRLRRAPAGRGDPLRHREVRRRPGLARSSRTARSRPSRPSRTPPGCSATRSRWGRSSPRRCRRR